MSENNTKKRNNLGNQEQKRQQRRSSSKQTADIPPYLKSLLDELAPAIKNYLNQAAESKARVAEARKKSAEAVEKLVENLPGIVQQTAPTRSTPSRRKISAKKQEVLDLINKLRDEEEMTYEEVAAYLTENNIPTFSGRGRWHQQTIHRLYMYPPA